MRSFNLPLIHILFLFVSDMAVKPNLLRHEVNLSYVELVVMKCQYIDNLCHVRNIGFHYVHDNDNLINVNAE